VTSDDPIAALSCALGYEFRDHDQLLTALSHASYAHETRGDRGNERLEFLGDAVLDLVVGEALYAAHPEWSEGQLTRARASLVRGDALAERAREISLQRFVKLGRTEVRSGGAEKDSILANVFEAVIGALYLDGGLEVAGRATSNLIRRGVEAFLAGAQWRDPKTALPSLIFVTSWMWVGFNMVVLLAALHSLPKEVIEASELDNCGWGQKLIYVILPLIWPTVLNLIVLSFIGKMKIFDLVWITTRGGPLWSTETVSTYVYKRAFDWTTFDLGYPSTIAAVWFVIVLGAVLTLTFALRQRGKLEY